VGVVAGCKEWLCVGWLAGWGESVVCVEEMWVGVGGRRGERGWGGEGGGGGVGGIGYAGVATPRDKGSCGKGLDEKKGFVGWGEEFLPIWRLRGGHLGWVWW